MTTLTIWELAMCEDRKCKMKCIRGAAKPEVFSSPGFPHGCGQCGTWWLGAAMFSLAFVHGGRTWDILFLSENVLMKEQNLPSEATRFKKITKQQ